MFVALAILLAVMAAALLAFILVRALIHAILGVLFALIGPLAIVGLVISGLVMMVAPLAGRRLLANVARGIGLLLLGSMMISMVHC